MATAPSSTAATPGATWAALGQREFTETATSHVYAESGDYTVDVEAVLRAEYRFAGSPWRAIAGTLDRGRRPAARARRRVRHRAHAGRLQRPSRRTRLLKGRRCGARPRRTRPTRPTGSARAAIGPLPTARRCGAGRRRSTHRAVAAPPPCRRASNAARCRVAPVPSRSSRATASRTTSRSPVSPQLRLQQADAPSNASAAGRARPSTGSSTSPAHARGARSAAARALSISGGRPPRPSRGIRRPRALSSAPRRAPGERREEHRRSRLELRVADAELDRRHVRRQAQPST